LVSGIFFVFFLAFLALLNLWRSVTTAALIFSAA
jgi:hypothetical protein